MKINSLKSDLTGKSFQYFDVISFAKRKRDGRATRTYWNCLCKRCGSECLCLTYQITNPKNKKSCGCLKKLNKKEHHSWRGYGELSGNQLNTIKQNAKTRNIPFKVGLKYLWNLFEKQNRKCALTGELLTMDGFRCKSNNTRISGCASLDRINSNLPYQKGNLRWVLKEVNLMKHIMTDVRLLEICNLIVKKALDSK